ncbi:hypothetical protein EON81_15930 [bacterium]|nr:MAG: hypothetical protein EON81_15930 [bacterium]
MKRTIWLGLILVGCGGNGQSGLNSPSMPPDMSASRKVAEMDPRVESKMVTKEASTLKFDVLKAEITVPEGSIEGSSQVSGKIPVDLKTKPEDNLIAGTLISFSGPKFTKPVELAVQKPKKKGEIYFAELKDNKWTTAKTTFDAKKNLFRHKTSELGTYAFVLKPKVKKDAAKKPEVKTGLNALFGKPRVKLPK